MQGRKLKQMESDQQISCQEEQVKVLTAGGEGLTVGKTKHRGCMGMCMPGRGKIQGKAPEFSAVYDEQKTVCEMLRR